MKRKIKEKRELERTREKRKATGVAGTQLTFIRFLCLTYTIEIKFKSIKVRYIK